MRIIVPSLGRAGTSHSATWLEQQQREVVFAVHLDETTDYKRAYPWAVVMPLPENTRRHTGLVRKWIIEHEQEPFFFVDDDISVRLVNFRDYDAMFDQLEHHMLRGKVCMAGIGKQIFSNGVIPHCGPAYRDPLMIRDKFCSTVYGIDPRKFRHCPLEKFQVYEDCALIIHAIRATGNIVSYSATHTNKTPREGGCNSWRTPEIIRSSMRALAAEYPEVVQIRDTRDTAHGQDLGVGVRVAWSKIRQRWQERSVA